MATDHIGLVAQLGIITEQNTLRKIDVCETLMPPFPDISGIGLRFDLDLSPTDLNINRDHLLIEDYLPTNFEAYVVKHSWVIRYTKCWRRTWLLTLTFWPTDLNIDKYHLLIKDYLPSNFEASGAKRSWVVSCTWRLKGYQHTNQHVQSNMPLLLRRGHNK